MLTNELTDALIAGLDPAIYDGARQVRPNVRFPLTDLIVDARVERTSVRQENCMRAFFVLSWLARKLDQPISCF